MTATRPISSSSIPPGWIDPIATYGAVGDGIADDTVPIQSAITAAKAVGGTVYLDPTKTFKITAALNLDNAGGIRLTGGGAANHTNTGKPTLKFTGTGSGSVLQCHSIFGVEIDHIRIQYTSALFTGDLIDVDGNPNAADCTNWHIHHVATTGAPNTARSGLRMNKAIIGKVNNCHWAGCANGVRMADPGGSYVVSVALEDNTYNFSGTAHVLIGSGDAENISIRGETFEAGTNTPGVKGDTCQLYTFMLENCWFGDSGAATNWVNGLQGISNNAPMTIRNNFFGDSGGVHIGGGGGVFIVEGNHFIGSTAFDLNAGVGQLIANYNYFNNCTIFAGLRPNTCEAHSNLCASATETKILRDVLPARMGFGNRNGGGGLEAGPTDGTEQLIVGVSNNGLKAPNIAKGMVYSYPVGGNMFATVVQSPNSGDGTEAQLVAGLVPVPVVRVAGPNKLGFYNTPPVARTAAYTLNAGAVSRNLPAAGTTLDVEKALRQLITDLQANGLLA